MTDSGRSIPHFSRRAFLGVGVATTLAGCSGLPREGGIRGDPARDGSESVVAESAFVDLLEEPEVPLAWSLSELADAPQNSPAGDDDIPAIDGPATDDIAAGNEMMHDNSVVFGVNFEDGSRAYPLRVLVWHEIVNDTLGGREIAITYCPLTGTAIGFFRGDVTFGVRGSLINSNLIMFDRQTDSCWPQILGTAVEGPLRGRSLPEFHVVWTTWRRWREAHPETSVMTEDTGYIRDYGRNPYGRHDPPSGYNISDSLLFPVMHRDESFHPKRIFLGTRTADGMVAFDKERLREDRILSARLDGTAYFALYDEQLDTGFVYRDAGDETPRGTEITRDAEGYRYQGTRFLANELPLQRVNVFDVMWFAWVAFYPDTVVVA